MYDLDNYSSSVGIWVEGTATGTISCNYIHDINCNGHNSYGIIHNSSLVKDNHISNITGLSPKGIQTRYTNSRNINNYISNSGIGLNISGSWANSNILIANNTFYANKKGIEIDYEYKITSPTIVNNLFTNNTYGIGQNGTAIANSTISIDHNLFWKQTTADFSNILIAGIGQTVTTNPSGYPIDSYFNLYQDPLYNGAAPFLSTNSPCNSSGNSTYSSKIGFNNPMGCKGTVISVNELKDNTKRLSVFPNPTSGSFYLSTDYESNTMINIFDISGRKVHSTNLSPHQQVNADHLENGVYLLTFKQGEITGKTLLVISK